MHIECQRVQVRPRKHAYEREENKEQTGGIPLASIDDPLGTLCLFMKTTGK